MPHVTRGRVRVREVEAISVWPCVCRVLLLGVTPHNCLSVLSEWIYRSHDLHDFVMR